MELNGVSAIVARGASGIGAATARQLADLGARVVIADMLAERGEALASEIGGVFVPVDVTNTEQIIDAVKTASDLCLLRALVNSAGAAAFDGQIGQAAYSSSKGGVVGLTLPVPRAPCAVTSRTWESGSTPWRPA